jgi:hypothetical protein
MWHGIRAAPFPKSSKEGDPGLLNIFNDGQFVSSVREKNMNPNSRADREAARYAQELLKFLEKKRAG